MSETEETLLNALQRHSCGGPYPLHMPGHKRMPGPLGDICKIDITEIEGFDDLHFPEGILKDAQDRAARVWGAEKSFFLVNGSTCGVLAAVSACFGPGAKGRRLLMARNCHRSVYHAAILERLETAYIEPEMIRGERGTVISGAVTPESVEEALKRYDDIGAVCITSPTYEGVVSDIASIAALVHKKGIPLIVDEAHGAHFGFHPAFPGSALSGGADLVIQSLHKTLPALTQCALLHLQGEYVRPENVARYLRIYQTSSPSYVLMASMDECVRLMEDSHDLFEALDHNTRWFYQQAASLKNLEIIRTDDPSRIVIGQGRSGLSGEQICAILRERFGMECEMAVPSHALALMTIADRREAFEALFGALETIDRECPGGEALLAKEAPLPRQMMNLYQGWQMETEKTALCESNGRISSEFVYMYPPGIPILAPGELIDEPMSLFLTDLSSNGIQLRGMNDPAGEYIRTRKGE